MRRIGPFYSGACPDVILAPVIDMRRFKLELRFVNFCADPYQQLFHRQAIIACRMEIISWPEKFGGTVRCGRGYRQPNSLEIKMTGLWGMNTLQTGGRIFCPWDTYTKHCRARKRRAAPNCHQRMSYRRGLFPAHEVVMTGMIFNTSFSGCVRIDVAQGNMKAFLSNLYTAMVP